MSPRSRFWRALRATLLASSLRRTLLTAPLTGVAAELARRVATEEVLLHGTAADVEEFVPRVQTDFDGSRTFGVFATDIRSGRSSSRSFADTRS